MAASRGNEKKKSTANTGLHTDHICCLFPSILILSALFKPNKITAAQAVHGNPVTVLIFVVVLKNKRKIMCNYIQLYSLSISVHIQNRINFHHTMNRNHNFDINQGP